MATRSKRTTTKRKKAKKPEDVTDDERASGMGRWFGIVVLLLVVTTGALILVVYPRSAGPGNGSRVEIDIAETNATDLADKLKKARLIDNTNAFIWYVRLTGGTGSIVKGHHVLTDDASPRELMHRLERRNASRAKIVVPEGWTCFDIAKRLDAAHVCTARAFLDATTSHELLAELKVPPPSADGYLFPATYDFELDSDAQDLVRQMVRNFDKKYEALESKHEPGLKDLSDSMAWGRREIVVLASIVEKEAAVDDERPIVASVFLNRLRDPTFTPKRLQSDPTAGYGCLIVPTNACASYIGKITHDINADPDNPYSTYTHDGLPPGPIGNPGVKSIEAVMSPALTHYFYFVAKGGGRHTFSETLGSHNAAVDDNKKGD
jgi:UPF0755 protein